MTIIFLSINSIPQNLALPKLGFDDTPSSILGSTYKPGSSNYLDWYTWDYNKNFLAYVTLPGDSLQLSIEINNDDIPGKLSKGYTGLKIAYAEVLISIES